VLPVQVGSHSVDQLHFQEGNENELVGDNVGHLYRALLAKVAGGRGNRDPEAELPVIPGTG
jgi:hypothetical protein